MTVIIIIFPVFFFLFFFLLISLFCYNRFRHDNFDKFAKLKLISDFKINNFRLNAFSSHTNFSVNTTLIKSVLSNYVYLVFSIIIIFPRLSVYEIDIFLSFCSSYKSVSHIIQLIWLLGGMRKQILISLIEQFQVRGITYTRYKYGVRASFEYKLMFIRSSVEMRTYLNMPEPVSYVVNDIRARNVSGLDSKNVFVIE